jgi:hypothetical protein
MAEHQKDSDGPHGLEYRLEVSYRRRSRTTGEAEKIEDMITVTTLRRAAKEHPERVLQLRNWCNYAIQQEGVVDED